MNAIEVTPEASQEWTSQQKYQRMRPKDLIEIRLINQPGVDPKWHEARIVNTNRGGAFAELTNGRLKRFFHWNDCRMPAKPEKHKPLATLGEIATGVIPSLQAPPPPQKPLPVFAPTPAPAAVAAPAPAPLVLFRRDPMPDNKTSRTPHPPTDGNGRLITSTGVARALPTRVSNDPRAIGSQIGSFISEERKRRGITQLGLADLATAKSDNRKNPAVYNSRISQIELGKSLPNDNELLAIAEALNLSLDRMIELRDTDESERAAERSAERERREIEKEKEERAAREAREAVRRASIAPPVVRIEPQRTEAERQAAVYQSAPSPDYAQVRAAIPEPPPYTPPPRVVAMQTDLASFVESVEALVAMPVDREARKSWFACVMELYRLSGGQP
jgi:transcriptional regulator with XRE-family HTH domain